MLDTSQSMRFSIELKYSRREISKCTPTGGHIGNGRSVSGYLAVPKLHFLEGLAREKNSSKLLSNNSLSLRTLEFFHKIELFPFLSHHENLMNLRRFLISSLCCGSNFCPHPTGVYHCQPKREYIVLSRM